MSSLQWVDEKLGEILSQWNIYTVVLGVTITAFVAHSLFTFTDPDVHPMILQRQSYADRVRNPGESAIYRSPDAPHGAPLRTGLGVKLKTDKPYSGARNGDLRHIWEKVRGEIEAPAIPGISYGPQQEQKIFTVYGREKLVEHTVSDLTKEIAILGNHLHKSGSKRIAVYLPNSVELLDTLFAASFFGLSVILLPFNQPHPLVVEFLQETKADALVAAAGSVPLGLITQGAPSVKQLVWVVEETSRHMDWTDVPSGLGGSVDVNVWHELVNDLGDSAIPPFPDLKSSELGEIVTIWQNEPLLPGKIVSFKHGNFVSAIAALIAALPIGQRVRSTDLFFSADSWTNTYALSQTLAALFTGASLAISSVAGPDVDLTFAAKQIAPTVVVASAESANTLHASVAPAVSAGIPKLAHNSSKQTLASGIMPKGNILQSLTGATKAAIGSTPGALRLLFITEKSGSTNPPLSSSDLNDIRIFSGARAIYALTAPTVAGAVAQTNVFDYRSDSSTKHSHFGVPLSSLEVKLVDSVAHKTTDERAKGEIVVSGPSVSNGTSNLGIVGTFRDDCTLAYV